MVTPAWIDVAVSSVVFLLLNVAIVSAFGDSVTARVVALSAFVGLQQLVGLPPSEWLRLDDDPAKMDPNPFFQSRNPFFGTTFATAFALWDMSQERAIRWGVSEWRFFLMCVCFSPRALEGVALLDEHFPRKKWDEFVALTYVRVLRFNDPSRIVPILRRWSSDGVHLSPLPLQQAIKGQLLVRDPRERVDGLQFLLDAHASRDIYTTRYADRLIAARLEELQSEEAAAASSGSDDAEFLRRERRILDRFRKLMPRSSTVAEVKDSVSDVLPMKTKRHTIYGGDEGA